MPGDFHLVHLGSKALGGAGLVMTEMVCVSEPGGSAPAARACTPASQEAAWRRDRRTSCTPAPARGSAIQLGHSGRKGSTRLMWEGIDEPLAEGNWEVCGPSADALLPGQPGARGS